MPSSLRGHDQAEKSLSPGITFDRVEPFFRSKPTAAIAEMLLGLLFVRFMGENHGERRRRIGHTERQHFYDRGMCMSSCAYVSPDLEYFSITNISAMCI